MSSNNDSSEPIEDDPYNVVSEVTEDDIFIKVYEEEGTDAFVELPAEDDGTMLISTLQGQFPCAVGLRYKSSSGSWRGVRMSDNALKPPQGGWGDGDYYVTLAKEKPKTAAKGEPTEKEGKEEINLKKDLFVINLADEVNDDSLKDYFTLHCGEMELSEVKYDRGTGKSRGFGFIRFKTAEATKEALNGEHIIGGQRVEVRISRKREIPCQLFIGRLPEGSTKEDLKEHFEQYGELTEAYITSPFRGFGFVTYASTEVAHSVLRKPHEIKGVSLNVAVAEPKEDRGGRGGRSRDDYGRGRDSRRRDDYDNSRSRSRHDRSSRDSRGGRYGGGGGGGGGGGYPDDMMDEFKGMIYEMMSQRRR